MLIAFLVPTFLSLILPTYHLDDDSSVESFQGRVQSSPCSSKIQTMSIQESLLQAEVGVRDVTGERGNEPFELQLLRKNHDDQHYLWMTAELDCVDNASGKVPHSVLVQELERKLWSKETPCGSPVSILGLCRSEVWILPACKSIPSKSREQWEKWLLLLMMKKMKKWRSQNWIWRQSCLQSLILSTPLTVRVRLCSDKNSSKASCRFSSSDGGVFRNLFHKDSTASSFFT